MFFRLSHQIVFYFSRALGVLTNSYCNNIYYNNGLYEFGKRT